MGRRLYNDRGDVSNFSRAIGRHVSSPVAPTHSRVICGLRTRAPSAASSVMDNIFCCGDGGGQACGYDLEEPASFSVTAPPGKLGLAFTMAESGEYAVVHLVRPASPLKEQLQKGDVIIAVDGENTSTYTHDQLVKLMSDKQGAPRMISVRRM